ncbi:transcriptional regulator with XRE-family HTH domain [Saccharothrix coeruleofusca]|uniref:XRE family transcriptional regulator n=1 Tax=Saccharothrix coeruleofusca TaxID=33919 RepID=UPI001AEB2E73|nr:XRE family transcriptional regulator [Saccharothrix coeruleofusca]MBP2336098.1 transcriptional regulator with XRE-family HTH domain [Saccharothrix coeruleofusca]
MARENALVWMDVARADTPGPALGSLLSTYRRRAGLTQEQLSELSGVSVRAISDVEGGRARWPQRRTGEALASALGLRGDERAEFLRATREGRVAARSRPRAGGVAPSLPMPTADFAGREAELAVLTGLGRTAADTAVLHGPPGAGKTSTAVQAGHLVQTRFPDGGLLVDMAGSTERPTSPNEVLDRVLRVLGAELPAHPEDRVDLVRSALRGRRLLLVLDDVADEAQVRPVLAAGAGRLVLLTSRRTLAGLERVTRIGLGALPEDAALELLRSIAGGERVAAEPEAAVEVVRLCGHLPLAVRIAGNRLVSRPRWSIAHLADRLRDPRRRLTALTAGDLRLAEQFASSYRRLDPDAALVFRGLGLAPTRNVDVELAAALAGVDTGSAADALEELVDACLLEAAEGDRYAMHDLLRVFAQQLVAEEERTDQVSEARRRAHGRAVRPECVGAGRPRRSS